MIDKVCEYPGFRTTQPGRIEMIKLGLVDCLKEATSHYGIKEKIGIGIKECFIFSNNSFVVTKICIFSKNFA